MHQSVSSGDVAVCREQWAGQVDIIRDLIRILVY
jgi:hypothetical protein